MAKQGMKRSEETHTQPRNQAPPVPEIQGKAKHGKAHVNSIIAGTKAPTLKVYHSTPFSLKNSKDSDSLSEGKEKSISTSYSDVDSNFDRDSK